MVLSSLLIENITKVGSNTEGVFSDVLDKLLPNGWELDLSNEVYLDTKGVNYEGVGIPADVKLDYALNTQTFLTKIVNDLDTTGDKAIELVLKAN
jgi:C-terminal processing protease CtpA/Prc